MLELYFTDAESVHGYLNKLLAPYGRKILRTEEGKPYLAGNPVYFSLSHSCDKAVIALSDKPVGVDTELFKERNFQTVLSRFTPREQAEIDGNFIKFLENWTAKEAFTKLKGGRIFSYIKGLEYFGGALYFNGSPQSVDIYTQKTAYGIVTVCTEK